VIWYCFILEEFGVRLIEFSVGLRSLSDRFDQVSPQSRHVRPLVNNNPEMTKIKRHILERLRQQDGLFPYRVGKTDLIEDIWIAPGAIRNDHTGSMYRRPNVSHDGGRTKEIVCPAHTHVKF
jgi:hypothetical protein